MYQETTSFDLITIIAGILSIIVIITFFVMAFRLKKIKQYLYAMSTITRGEAKKTGWIEADCPKCEKTNYILSKDPPILCAGCEHDLTEGIANMTKEKKN